MDQQKSVSLSSFAAIAALMFWVTGPAIADGAGSPPPPGPWDQQSAWNMELVGYNDLQGRSTYQPLIIRQGNREIAYMAHHAGLGLNPLTGQMESNGTSILDVTNPKSPKYLAHIPGPAGSIDAGGSQMARVCSGDVLPSLTRQEAARKHGHWYLLRTHGNSSGLTNPIESQEIYDVTDPSNPKFPKTIVSHLSNTHKNWWECETGIAYLVANDPNDDWKHSGSTQHLKIYNLHDPSNPQYIRDFGLVGQQPGATTFEGPVNPPSGIHGPISGYPVKDRLYAAYGVGSNGVIQIIDRKKLLTGNPNDVLSPQISYWTLTPNSPGDQGGHTSFPIYKKRQDLLLVTSEEGVNECTDSTSADSPDHIAWLYDITNEKKPTQLSTLTVPRNPGDFCHRAGGSEPTLRANRSTGRITASWRSSAGSTPVCGYGISATRAILCPWRISSRHRMKTPSQTASWLTTT